MLPQSYDNDAICQGIREALDGAPFVLSEAVTLERCMGALDLGNPLLDRGMLEFSIQFQDCQRHSTGDEDTSEDDNGDESSTPTEHTSQGQSPRKRPRQSPDVLNIWEYNQYLIQQTPVAFKNVNADDFAASLMCILLEWLAGYRLAQDTILSVPTLLHPSFLPRDDLKGIVMAIWRIIDAATATITCAGFHKDERAVSRHFFTARPRMFLAHCQCSWLREWMLFFVGRRWEAGGTVSLPFIPETCLIIELCFPILANLYGLGCPRRPHLPLSIARANALINAINTQWTAAIYTSTMLHSTPVFSGFTEPANLLSAFLFRLPSPASFIYAADEHNDAHQIVRAALVKALFTATDAPFTRASPFWQRAGGPSNWDEFRAVCDAFHILLHSPPRQYRLIADWLVKHAPLLYPSIAGQEEGSTAFRVLFGWMRGRWVEVGLGLRLYLSEATGVGVPGGEEAEAREWMEAISRGSLPRDIGKRSIRYYWRWRPLILSG